MDKPKRIITRDRQVKRILNCRVTVGVAEEFEKEAIAADLTVAEYLRQTVENRSQYKQTMTAILEGIDRGNTELSDALHTEVKDMMRKFYAAQGAQVKELREDLAGLKKAREEDNEILRTLLVGVMRLLGVGDQPAAPAPTPAPVAQPASRPAAVWNGPQTTLVLEGVRSHMFHYDEFKILHEQGYVSAIVRGVIGNGETYDVQAQYAAYSVHFSAPANTDKAVKAQMTAEKMEELRAQVKTITRTRSHAENARMLFKNRSNGAEKMTANGEVVFVEEED